MKVKDLIAELQKQDPEAEVIKRYWQFGIGDASGCDIDEELCSVIASTKHRAYHKIIPEVKTVILS